MGEQRSNNPGKAGDYFPDALTPDRFYPGSPPDLANELFNPRLQPSGERPEGFMLGTDKGGSTVASATGPAPHELDTGTGLLGYLRGRFSRRHGDPADPKGDGMDIGDLTAAHSRDEYGVSPTDGQNPAARRQAPPEGQTGQGDAESTQQVGPSAETAPSDGADTAVPPRDTRPIPQGQKGAPGGAAQPAPGTPSSGSGQEAPSAPPSQPSSETAPPPRPPAPRVASEQMVAVGGLIERLGERVLRFGRVWRYGLTGEYGRTAAVGLAAGPFSGATLLWDQLNGETNGWLESYVSGYNDRFALGAIAVSVIMAGVSMPLERSEGYPLGVFTRAGHGIADWTRRRNEAALRRQERVQSKFGRGRPSGRSQSAPAEKPRGESQSGVDTAQPASGAEQAPPAAE